MTRDRSFPAYEELTGYYDEGRKSKDKLERRPDLVRYNYTWQGHTWYLYAIRYYFGGEYGELSYKHYIVAEPSSTETVERKKLQHQVNKLILAASNRKTSSADEEIWVFDDYWEKSKRLWQDVQNCSWEDVIQDEVVKRRVKDDMEGFFSKKDDYKAFAVPWKRYVACRHPFSNTHTTFSSNSRDQAPIKH